MANKDIPSRLIDYLVAGATREQAATALGISASYISDLYASEEFQAKLTEKRSAVLDKRLETETTIREVETLAINKIKHSIGMIMDPMKILQVFKVVNSARLSQAIQQPVVSTSPVVALTLPISLVNNFVIDSTNKIIALGDQTLVTLPTGNLERLANDSAKPIAIREGGPQLPIQLSNKTDSEFERFGLPASSS